jgi:integrase
MATVFKRTRRLPVPDGAEIVEYRGKPYATWRSRGGRQRKAPLTDDGQAVEVVDDNYTVEWYAWDGKRKRLCGGPDKDAATALGAAKEAEEAQRRRGLIDPAQERHAGEGRGPLAEHLADFRRSLEAKGDTTGHIDLTMTRLARTLAACNVQRLGDISPSAVAAAVASLRDSGLSLRTCNGYLRAVKTFSRWAWRDGRTPSDAAAPLVAYNTEADRRRQRRALSPGDFTRLVQAAEAGPEVEGVSGPDRAVMYILAGWTGFRRRELASLTPRSFDFATTPATLTLAAAYAKNRRADTLPLHPAVVMRLRAWLASRATADPDAPLFPLRTPGGCWRKTSKMVRLDLERAGLPYVDEDGAFADFHAHRHMFISNLGKAGVPLATAQKLARHSDPKLTANIYTHLGISDKAAAVEMLPDCPVSSSEAGSGQQASMATGTDDARTVRT